MLSGWARHQACGVGEMAMEEEAVGGGAGAGQIAPSGGAGTQRPTFRISLAGPAPSSQLSSLRAAPWASCLVHRDDSDSRSIPGVLFHSGGLVGSTLGAKRYPFSGLGDRTPYAPRRRGGPTSFGRGAVPHHQKLFSCGFLWHTLLNRCRPDL